MKPRTSIPLVGVASIVALGLLAAPAEAGTETSGLFVEFTATKNQDEVPATLATKEMCPDRAGTHTFAPDLRVENKNELVITNTFIGFEFSMTLTRSGTQPTLVKTARFRVTRNGIRPIAGGAARINFFLQPGDCVRLTFAPEADLFLLTGEILTASLFLTKEPAGPPTLLGSTNRGHLVRINLSAGTVQLIGISATAAGWADLAMDPAGNLYAVSRWRLEAGSVCGGHGCAHLYRVDPNSGATIQHIGDLQVGPVSDIEFASDGTLYGSRRFGESPGGGLVTIDPKTASTVAAPNSRFGPGLENGGLAQHPVTGEFWVVEADSSPTPSIFRVDPSTGLATGPSVRLGIDGAPVPVDFGFDALDILPDGRFIATRGHTQGLVDPTTGLFTTGVFEINPSPDPTSGLAEVTLIPLTFDPTIDGNVNGLTR